MKTSLPRGFSCPIRGVFLFGLVSLIALTPARASTVSALFVRGFTVVPEPQQLTFDGDDFQIENGWRLESTGIDGRDGSIESLRDGLLARDRINLGNGENVLRLSVQAGSVSLGPALAADKAALATEAYRLWCTAN